MPNYVQYLQLGFSAVVIAIFGYRQFNSWTRGESCRATTDSELLAFAPPRSFTPLWRFLGTASLYCGTLIVLYAVLWALLGNEQQLGAGVLDVSGVTRENAWLVALFIVTGLSPILPVFSNAEQAIREVMHNWAVVPAKAQDMANELASPTTTFDLDEAFLRDTVLPSLGDAFNRADFTKGRAVTIAQKWCRLKMLLMKFAPPAQDGLAAPRFKSPYATRFVNECRALERDLRDLSEKTPELLRTVGGSPSVVALSERLDRMQLRLYVLMCCGAFASARSVDEVIRYFRRCYGIGVGHVQLSSAPFDPILDTLVVVTVVVLTISLVFRTLYHDIDRVHPFLWAVSAFCTHGAGLLVGWLVFSRWRRQHLEWNALVAAPVSRKLLLVCVVLSFALAVVPTFLGAVYADYLNGVVKPPLALASDALLRSWPWAFLGSATAAATFVHLERTASKEVTLRLRATSAVTQAAMNVGIALAILAVWTPGSSGSPPDLVANLERPVFQLILLLTGAIGVVLGLFLPRIVHGYGLDRRAGVERFSVENARAQAVFTFSGRQVPITVTEMSLSGAALEMSDANLEVGAGRQGVLTLADGSAITVYIARLVTGEDQASGAGPKRFAVRHACMSGPVRMAPAITAKLQQFLASSTSPLAA